MRVGTRSGWGLVGALLAMRVLGVGAPAGAEEPMRAGMKDVTLAGAFSVSHDVTEGARNLETVKGYDLIPHLGFVLTDERGDGWLRGNFEVLVEPTLIRLEAANPATVGGVSTLGRWVFTGRSLVRPYVEAGAGVLGGHTRLRQTTCDLNFVLEGGAGALLFMSGNVALTVGYRFQHISNGSRCTPNLGLNSSMFVLGLSYFFP